ncbi:CRP-like cAMP-binding protein [Lewinella aquimaris]|uniref:CRP-like cAMP-binding protein n=1 Tax=Neolewinella aquimaris TaxID=1835722 RepID=A0A840EH94_9BACT|nr:Crp/Fnr family transcriptional regulator [Neolewinella aquimaris]MBB4080276.1 CRP-like cAMP-binding protein [Neolewinella aquimaris]
MTNPLQALHALLDPAERWTGPIDLKRGEPLVLPGTVDRNLYRVEEGTLMACLDVEGEQQCTRFGYAGEYVLVLDSYLSGGPTAYSLIALRRTRLSALSYAAQYEWLGIDDSHRKAWEESKEWLIAGLLEREVDLLTASPEARYRRVLARSPRLFQEVPAKYIANYLRMSPETLSRLKKS